MVKIETHCHSHHSFDCNTSIASIIETCEKRGIKGIVICDHDVCGITAEEEALFIVKNITLYKAIEFTTKTNAHVIGVSPRIKELEKPRNHYELGVLIEKLQTLGATIIIPHPNHETGIMGNGKIPVAEIEKAFKAAHFVEKENYRYGKTESDFDSQYKHLRYLIGSDAHSANNVGAFLNQVNEINDDFLLTMKSVDLNYFKYLDHGKGYWVMKAVKRSAPYQLMLRLFPAELRRKIKNATVNR